jgi:hypothetical protein
MYRLICLIIFSFFLIGLAGDTVLAQTDKITLSITPPLIKNNVAPGEVWRSAIKLINNNPREITVYVQVVDFKSGDQEGAVRFVQSVPATDIASSSFLSQWVKIDKEPMILKPFESRTISFIVAVPPDASPGGHYAAILAGTQPPSGKIQGSAIKISSLLASLLLIKVKGEVKEEGTIREFSTEKKFYTSPKVNFTVQFENKGNTHLQPQGEIRIVDFWNKEKGRITINHNTEFGNVLPGGTRKWQFGWQAPDSLLSMGRYRADLVLGFGEEARQTVGQSLYFWIIYPKPLAVAAGSLLSFVLIIILLVRFYVRRAIRQTQKQIGLNAPRVQSRRRPNKKVSVIPKGNNVIDLKKKR